MRVSISEKRPDLGSTLDIVWPNRAPDRADDGRRPRSARWRRACRVHIRRPERRCSHHWSLAETSLELHQAVMQPGFDRAHWPCQPEAQLLPAIAIAISQQNDVPSVLVELVQALGKAPKVVAPFGRSQGVLVFTDNIRNFGVGVYCIQSNGRAPPLVQRPVARNCDHPSNGRGLT